MRAKVTMLAFLLLAGCSDKIDPIAEKAAIENCTAMKMAADVNHSSAGNFVTCVPVKVLP